MGPLLSFFGAVWPQVLSCVECVGVVRWGEGGL